jgi:hypothetical protein
VSFPSDWLAPDLIIHILLADFAGNLVIKTTEVVKQDSLPINLTCFDFKDQNDSEYTGQPVIQIKFNFDNQYIISSYRSDQNLKVLGSKPWYPTSTNMVLDTLIIDSIGDGPYTIHGQCQVDHDNIFSTIASASIKLDTKAPQIISITGLDGEPLSGITDQKFDFKIAAIDSEPGRIESLKVSSHPDFEIINWSFPWTNNNEEMTFTVEDNFSQKCERTYYFKVIDFAEHESPVVTMTIYYDPDFKNEEVYNYPNPFTPPEKTTIVIYTTGKDEIKVNIYDMFGNKVIHFQEPADRRTRREVEWGGNVENEDRIVADGAYYCIVNAGRDRQKTIIVVKK